MSGYGAVGFGRIGSTQALFAVVVGVHVAAPAAPPAVGVVGSFFTTNKVQMTHETIAAVTADVTATFANPSLLLMLYVHVHWQGKTR